MKNRQKIILAGLFLTIALTGCGKDPQITQFKTDLDAFCTEIAEIDAAMESVDFTSETATGEVLGYLDELDACFLEFSELDFPEQYDYMEALADEASSYMTEAVASYRDASTNDTYDSATAKAQFQYAAENYARAYKRIQIIVALLHGEKPEDLGLVTQSP